VNKPVAPAGFALPAVLVVIALASSLTITCVTMVLAASRIAAGDAGARQAYEVAQAGFADACEQLRWSWPLGREGTGVVAAGDVWYETRATSLPSSNDAPARMLVTSVGHSGSASKVLTTEVALEPTGLPAGLTVAGDIEACAPVTIEGSGVYASGDVSGRQLITFAADGSPTSPQPPPDWADGEHYLTVAVHAAGQIFDEKGEEHDPGRQPATTSADTDRHTPAATQPLPCAPDEMTLTSLAAHALPVSSVLRDGVVDVGGLPLQPSAGDATMPGDGLVIVVGAGGSDEGVRLVGNRPPPPVACPLTVVVIGDATAGAADQGSPSATWWGSLIVTGGLVVANPLELHGSLFARHLIIVAPLHLELEQAWRLDPPPGYLSTVVIAREW
jgi:hypothetical protein